MEAETRDRAIDTLMQHWREHGRAPESVYAFCRGLGIDEREFFATFASLEAVESAFWRRMVERVAAAVEAGDEWIGFSARARLLSFLYAFFEAALAERSLFLVRLRPQRVIGRPAFLRGFEEAFEGFADKVIAHGRFTGEIADRGPLLKGYPRVFYTHLRGCVDFYVRDESAGFERTDAFIEKTVALAFDLIGPQAVDSAADLLRFLAPRAFGRRA